jgi:hypothetical protein
MEMCISAAAGKFHGLSHKGDDIEAAGHNMSAAE